MAGMACDSEFHSKKNKRNRKRIVQDVELDSVKQLVRKVRDQLNGMGEEGKWFSDCFKLLNDVWNASRTPRTTTRCLALGLGSPSASNISRVQLAFFIELCSLLNVPRDVISLYDPAFGPSDIALFKELGLSVLVAESEAEPRIPSHLALSSHTFCFMPHCELELYEALLAANRGGEGSIMNLFLVGNSLQGYVDRPTAKMRASAPFVLELGPTLVDLPLPPCPLWPTAFNSTSIQYITGN